MFPKLKKHEGMYSYVASYHYSDKLPEFYPKLSGKQQRIFDEFIEGVALRCFESGIDYANSRKDELPLETETVAKTYGISGEEGDKYSLAVDVMRLD